MSILLALTVIVLVLLGVLGHTMWHHQEIVVANAIVGLFTGGHVTG